MTPFSPLVLAKRSGASFGPVKSQVSHDQRPTWSVRLWQQHVVGNTKLAQGNTKSDRTDLGTGVAQSSTEAA